MGTDPAPGTRGSAAPAMGNFQLEDFVAGWIGGERIPGWEGPPEVSALTGQPGPRGRERASRELRRRS